MNQVWDRLSRLNLNQLLTLHAILSAGSAAGGARLLRRSQPAVSDALKACRITLEDDLLTREGNQNVLTPFAARVVLPALNSAFRTLHGILPGGDQTSPRTHYTVMTSDYVVYTLLTGVLVAIATAAPQVRVNVVPLAHDFFSQLRAGDDVDLLIMPSALTTPLAAAEFQHLSLFRDRFVLALSQETFDSHPDPVAEIGELPYVQYSGGLMASLADTAMDEAGIPRGPGPAVPNFLQIPLMLVRQSPLVSVIHHRVATEFGRAWPLRTADPPIDWGIEPICEVMYWTERNHEDAANIWLRNQISRAAEDL